jgi:pimeloyl-ACP methyl ester carboxylesterase
MKKIFKKIVIRSIGTELQVLYKLKPEKTLRKIFKLFCTPQKGKFKELSVFLTQAKGAKFNISGESVQTYHWEGPAKHILLVHGWQSNSSRWEGLIGKLQQKNHAVTAVDLPAHGNSTGKHLDLRLISATVKTCLEKFQPDMIIAHSLSASGIVYENWRNPLSENLKLILLSPPAEMIDLLENFRSILHLPQKIINQLDPLVQENLGVSKSDCSIPKFAENLTQEGLLLHDRQDKIVPLSAAKKLNRAWKKGEFIVTNNSGHSLNDAHCQKTILNFVENQFP